jgi:hypothetical protein
MLQAFPGVGISWSVSNVIDEAVGKLGGDLRGKFRENPRSARILITILLDSSKSRRLDSWSL